MWDIGHLMAAAFTEKSQGNGARVMLRMMTGQTERPAPARVRHLLQKSDQSCQRIRRQGVSQPTILWRRSLPTGREDRMSLSTIAQLMTGARLRSSSF